MKTRVALVLETSGGGSGRHVIDLAGGLSRRGFDVTVVYSPRRAIASFVEALEAIPDLRLAPLDMARSVGIYDIRSLVALGALLKRLGPFDITHAHSSKAGALVRLLPARLTGKKLYTPHCFITMDAALGTGQRLAYGLIERSLARLGDLVVAVSQSEVDHALSLGLDRRRVTKVVNGANVAGQRERLASRRYLSVSNDDVVFGFVGRLDSQKDPMKFVEAINKAHDSVPAIRGVVFGDGPMRPELESAAMLSACQFMGWCEAATYMQGLDAFVLTSRYEAMPYTLIEALHSGLPIIARNVGGVAETVKEGVNGVVLASDATSADIAAQLVEIAGTPATLTQWARASKSMSAEFTGEMMVERIEAIYRRLLD